MPASTWKAVALLGLAALAGGALGGAITAHAGRGHDSGRGHARGYVWYLDMLGRDLALSPAQRDSVQIILRGWDRSMDSLWARMAPSIDSMRGALRAQISAQLTPEQQRQYQKITARLDAEREAARRERQNERDKGQNRQ